MGWDVVQPQDSRNPRNHWVYGEFWGGIGYTYLENKLSEPGATL